jgi:zinc/manganese transport system permease protein
MMLPAVAARHWALSVGGMCRAAVTIAAGAAYAGLLLSARLDAPTGPAVVLAAGLAWIVSVLVGPVEGLLPRWWRRRHLAG